MSLPPRTAKHNKSDKHTKHYTEYTMENFTADRTPRTRTALLDRYNTQLQGTPASPSLHR
jgi:hypothetical protein